MLFYPLLLTERSNISRQNSREATKCGKKLFRKRLDIFLWDRIGQQEFKQRLVSICSLISSDEVSLEPFPMTSLTFDFYLHSTDLLYLMSRLRLIVNQVDRRVKQPMSIG